MLNKFVFKKSTIVILVFVSIYLILAIGFADLLVKHTSRNKLYSDLKIIPYNKTGLLLGTGKFLKSGNINPFYSGRIKAAEELLKAGKIRNLIISGDNSRKDYNEPQDMKRDLINLGIDSTCLYLDYAGFRTFDSMVRTKEIFGQTNVTVISQRFHNERAIFISSKLGISAVGYNAEDVGRRFGFPVMLREKLARVKVVLDVLIGTDPEFLGDKISIP